MDLSLASSDWRSFSKSSNVGGRPRSWSWTAGGDVEADAGDEATVAPAVVLVDDDVGETADWLAVEGGWEKNGDFDRLL